MVQVTGAVVPRHLFHRADDAAYSGVRTNYRRGPEIR